MSDAAMRKDKATALLGDLAASPALYPLRFGPLLERLLLIPMSEPAYRAASFLDSRFPVPAGRGVWLPCAAVAPALAGAAEACPLHFIFHIGHAGSTLLSRLLDESGQVLSLREPLPLGSLAEAEDRLGRADSLLGEAGFASLVETLLRLWARGYPATRAVVVKATSNAARLAPRLLAARPAARAVYLGLSAETYLATLLGAGTPDLRLFAPERVRRLEGFLGAPPPPLHALSIGEIAAMSWLAERLTERAARAAAGPRILAVDFEGFLARRAEVMARILAHLGLDPGPRYLAGLAESPIFRRYSKDLQQGYTPEARARNLARSRAANAEEIRRGLAWLDRLAAAHGPVADALA